jgi:hypothetical protein
MTGTRDWARRLWPRSWQCHRIPRLVPARAPLAAKSLTKALPPNLKTIDMSKEPSCAKQHTTPITTEGGRHRPG